MGLQQKGKKVLYKNAFLSYNRISIHKQGFKMNGFPKEYDPTEFPQPVPAPIPFDNPAPVPSITVTLNGEDQRILGLILALARADALKNLKDDEDLGFSFPAYSDMQKAIAEVSERVRRSIYDEAFRASRCEERARKNESH